MLKLYAGLQIKYREDGERFMSTFHYDMSKEIEHARKASQMTTQVGDQLIIIIIIIGFIYKLYLNLRPLYKRNNLVRC